MVWYYNGKWYGIIMDNKFLTQLKTLKFKKRILNFFQVLGSKMAKLYKKITPNAYGGANTEKNQYIDRW